MDGWMKRRIELFIFIIRGHCYFSLSKDCRLNQMGITAVSLGCDAVAVVLFVLLFR